MPIDNRNPSDRIKYMINQAKANIVLVDKHTAIDIGGIDVEQIIKNEETNYVRENEIKDTDLAYIIFTSGSSGVPKGVMIEHGGMMNHISEKIKLLKLDNVCVVAHNASIGFDISIWQVLAPLCVGGTVVNIEWAGFSCKEIYKVIAKV